ncbi:DUF4156 domain-containing protein [Thalassomonas viridans]|uniref:DUF4156 domain-containing protein n=1 Tax=Thalassomonas viridans TaxID=137584 RepID=A0AAE9Z4M8_9GAMM|nr:DUF4156 domain-containing protein [Thalassomonas viridans]WDE05989.1 DUF4156 domain-containing protein [Thalassomonas viridans]
MKTLLNHLPLAIAVTVLAGCSAKPQNTGSSHILLTSHKAAPNCQFLGEVRGTQGNLLTATFTSDEDLILGARNELRNQAAQLGANYVVIEQQNQSVNLSGFGGAYNSTLFGNAYNCPQPAMTNQANS